jgi:putative CocE/NonD family hydrolase
VSRARSISVIALVGACVAASGAAFAPARASVDAPDCRRVAIEHGVRTRMRDGVSLVADVYRPDTPGRFPVLLERTPYDRRGDADMAFELAAHDYVVVVQDTRGRYESEGEFYPFRDEGHDGYDSVEWAASLPSSNGHVGMFGGSYVGATQMLAAAEHPPHLEAIFPYVTASEYYEGWTYQSGAFMQWFASSWTSILAVDTLRRRADARIDAKDWVATVPVEDYPVLSPPPASELAPYYRDWVRHERSDDYWKPWRVSDHYAEMTVKALHGCGWHDLFLKGSLANYLGMRDRAATADARRGQRLLVGPWAHAPTSVEGKIGDVVFGTSAVLDQTRAALEWFDYALKGASYSYATGKPVRIFVMGDNVWRDENEFPLARTRYTTYYFHAAHGANGIAGDGALRTDAPRVERAESFDYDPAHPVPTIGGRLCCGQANPPGPADQRPNEARPDVLVFSSEPLATDTEVTGFVTVELYAASSAVDTDFTAMLVDVDPSGYARFLTDGIVRARYRDTTARAEPIEPGKVYKYTIDLWATSNDFKAGHRIRVYVSSSNFPRFDRNLNTGEPILGSTRMVGAHQIVLHDAAHPSSIRLPVIPR